MSAAVNTKDWQGIVAAFPWSECKSLEWTNPIRHLVTQLAAGSEEGLDLEHIANGYKHSNDGDITRLRNAITKGRGDTRDIFIALLGKVIGNVGVKRKGKITPGVIIADNGRLKLVAPVKQLCFTGIGGYEGHPIVLLEPAEVKPAFTKPRLIGNNKLRDITDLRVDHESDTVLLKSELAESMRQFGWIIAFPAIKDENGLIITGHRRVRVAEALGIPIRTGTKFGECEIIQLKFGRGTDEDASRVAHAIASDIGQKPLSPRDRAILAQHLYNSREWSLEKIGTALGVSRRTIARDLRAVEATGEIVTEEFGHHAQTNPEHSQDVPIEGDPNRRQATGRPRKAASIGTPSLPARRTSKPQQASTPTPPPLPPRKPAPVAWEPTAPTPQADDLLAHWDNANWEERKLLIDQRWEQIEELRSGRTVPFPTH